MPKRTEFWAVVDAQIFVPALASAPQEASLYNAALFKCWKVVVSASITEEYQRVLNKLGFPGDIVYFEMSRLQVMNKLRMCECDHESLPDELAPRKDRHIVAPCVGGYANVIFPKIEAYIRERRRLKKELVRESSRCTKRSCFWRSWSPATARIS
jgi:hypothetical protein